MSEKETLQRFFDVYCGMIFNAAAFQTGRQIACSYDFTDERYQTLKERYPIEQVAKTGGDFERALRLCVWLAPNLTHKGDFVPAGKAEENAISLLDYSFGNSEHGINCTYKAKILVECCLALHIYARRVWLYPNSPYDGDCHVVVEIYDRAREKWIMIDPTTGGYFTDGKKPLSCLEMRKNFACRGDGTVVLMRQRTGDLQKLFIKNLNLNQYYAKNCFYIAVETVSAFGTEKKSDFAYLLPVGFDCKARQMQHAAWGLELGKKEKWENWAIEWFEKRKRSLETFTPLIGSPNLWNSPV